MLNPVFWGSAENESDSEIRIRGINDPFIRIFGGFSDGWTFPDLLDNILSDAPSNEELRSQILRFARLTLHNQENLREFARDNEEREGNALGLLAPNADSRGDDRLSYFDCFYRVLDGGVHIFAHLRNEQRVFATNSCNKRFGAVGFSLMMRLADEEPVHVQGLINSIGLSELHRLRAIDDFSHGLESIRHVTSGLLSSLESSIEQAKEIQSNIPINGIFFHLPDEFLGLLSNNPIQVKVFNNINIDVKRDWKEDEYLGAQVHAYSLVAALLDIPISTKRFLRLDVEKALESPRYFGVRETIHRYFPGLLGLREQEKKAFFKSYRKFLAYLDYSSSSHDCADRTCIPLEFVCLQLELWNGLRLEANVNDYDAICVGFSFPRPLFFLTQVYELAKIVGLHHQPLIKLNFRSDKNESNVEFILVVRSSLCLELSAILPEIFSIVEARNNMLPVGVGQVDEQLEGNIDSGELSSRDKESLTEILSSIAPSSVKYKNGKRYSELRSQTHDDTGISNFGVSYDSLNRNNDFVISVSHIEIDDCPIEVMTREVTR